MARKYIRNEKVTDGNIVEVYQQLPGLRDYNGKKYSRLELKRDLAKQAGLRASDVNEILKPEEQAVNHDIVVRYNSGKETLRQLEEHFGVSKYKIYQALHEEEKAHGKIVWRGTTLFKKIKKPLSLSLVNYNPLEKEAESEYKAAKFETSNLALQENDIRPTRKRFDDAGVQIEPLRMTIINLETNRRADHSYQKDSIVRVPRLNRKWSIRLAATAASLVLLFGAADYTASKINNYFDYNAVSSQKQEIKQASKFFAGDIASITLEELSRATRQ